MGAILHAELLGALTGICTVLVVLTGPDVPPPRSADPVVSRAEAQAAKRATRAECKRTRGRCHPTKERP